MDISIWARDAKPGERVTYYIGSYNNNHRDVGDIFASAMRAHLDGLVFLAQRRIRKGHNKGMLAHEATRVSPRVALRLGIMTKDRMLGLEREKGPAMFRAALGRAA